MSSNHLNLKHINIKCKYLVFGYIREAQLLLPNKSNPYFNIPSLITHLCIQYYWSEYFKIAGYNMCISPDKKYLITSGEIQLKYAKLLRNMQTFAINNAKYAYLKINDIDIISVNGVKI